MISKEIRFDESWRIRYCLAHGPHLANAQCRNVVCRSDNYSSNPLHRLRCVLSSYKALTLLDGDLRPEVADGEGDGLAEEPIARIAHETHTCMCAAGEWPFGSARCSVAGLHAFLVLGQADAPNEGEVVGQAQAIHRSLLDEPLHKKTKVPLLRLGVGLKILLHQREVLVLQAVEHYARKPRVRRA